MSAFGLRADVRLLAVFYRLDFGVPARGALICALFVAGFGRLNEPEPYWLLALGAWPKGKGPCREALQRLRH